CADSFAEARNALELVDVEWEVLEPLLDPEAAIAREALIESPRTRERGDFERALAEADVVVEATYRTQTVLHNSTETPQSVCRRLGGDDRGPAADVLRVPEREGDDLRREAEPAAGEGVPRSRLRRGHVRARVRARRARGEARPRPARAAAAKPRRRRARRRPA